MSQTGEHESMRRRFVNAREEEEASAPSFGRVWAAAEARSAAHPGRVRVPALAAAALALAAFAAVAFWPEPRPERPATAPAVEVSVPTANVEPVAESPRRPSAPAEAADNRNSTKKQPKSPATAKRPRSTLPADCAEC